MGQGLVPGERVVTKTPAHGKYRFYARFCPVLTCYRTASRTQRDPSPPSPDTASSMLININITYPEPAG